ncbi:MAG: class 1 fructose-bisphosphatase [Campylobacter sp.]|nr:class 1 fructose-bisphosphatase [Campylobacter sp.]MBR6952676.1 class 1 fructose-bisphosphatase [Campylobacter sp.]MBR7047938.1 class 1 fructose-bisphosphatase [Campylobacter sp.]
MQEIFKTIENIAKKISNELKFAEFGYTTNQNSTGDTQLKFDVLSDKIIENEFKNVGCVKALVSEEKDEMLNLNEKGEFIVAYDPLDGSSLFDVNFAIGSIFGIYKNEISSENLVAAAYTLYGPRLEMVVCESSPKLYRLNPQNEFVFINELKLKEKGKLNATGATQKGWSEKHKKLVNSLFDEGYRLRYSGAMVSDLHQILIKGGGLFSYPATTDAPNGKLRVTFEVLPFAFIYEKAGGATTNGTSNSLFEIKIEKIHQTSPCFFGSKYEIAKLHEIYGK